MFTKDDYLAYFDELHNILKKELVIYTDLLNELSDQSMTSKLHSLAIEDMDMFRAFADIKKKFI